MPATLERFLLGHAYQRHWRDTQLASVMLAHEAVLIGREIRQLVERSSRHMDKIA
jgi:hypothetical protein